MRPVSGKGNFFQTVRGFPTGRSVFDLSYELQTTCEYGLLDPVFVQEGLPGDVMTLGVQALIRQQPTIAPVMGRITATFHVFFVPKRLVWHNFERYLTRGVTGMTIVPHVTWPHYQSRISWSDTRAGTEGIGEIGIRSIDPNASRLEYMLGYAPAISPLDVGSLWDKFGLPIRCGYGLYTKDIDADKGNVTHSVGFLSDITVDDCLRRAYCMIWNDYYRDENLIDPIRNIDGSGEDELEQFDKLDVAACVVTGWQNEGRNLICLNQQPMMWLLPKAWPKDYFTSCLPWQQRGVSPAIPLSGTAVARWDSTNFNSSGSHNFSIGLTRNGDTATIRAVDSVSVADDTVRVANLLNNNKIDMSQVGTISMSDWYVAYGTQKWMEYQAKGGARLIETLQTQWGISPSDARLQRPEYIGGCKIPVVVSEVVQTSDSGVGDNATPLGTMAGHGMAVNGTYIGKYRVEEHGYFIGLLAFETSTGYQQGFPREFTRSASLEEPWPVFANLPEQGVLEREIFVPRTAAEAVDALPNRVFGFQARYNECRTRMNTVTGQMRVYSNDDYINDIQENEQYGIQRPAVLNGVIPASMSYWNFARYFSRRPLLNWYFMVAQPRKDNQRVLNEPPFIVQWANNVRMVRRLPYIPSPGIRG